MKLIPNIGLGFVRFGMNPSELIAVFPEKQKYESWMGGNLNDSLLFHGIIFSFDKCNSSRPLADSHLEEIRISGRDDVILWEQQITNWTKNSLENFLNENKISYEIMNNRAIKLKSLSMTFSFNEQNQIDYIQMWTTTK